MQIDRAVDQPVTPGVRVLAAFGVVYLVLLAPLIAFEFPPLIDYPTHLARHFIANELSTNEALSHFYDYSWRLIPYMASDVVGVPLSAVFSPYVAERILLGLIVFLWLAGPMVLYRTIWGHFSYWPLMSAFFVYNLVFVSATESFLLTSGLTFFIFAFWIRLGEAPLRVRLALALGLGFAVYACHLIAFFLFVITICLYELARVWTGGHRLAHSLRRSAVIGAALALPGLMHFAYLMVYHRPTYDPEAVGLFAYGGLLDRLFTVLSPTLFAVTYIETFFAACFILAIGVSLVLTRAILMRTVFAIVCFGLALVASFTPSVFVGVTAFGIRPPVYLAGLFFGMTRFNARRKNAFLIAIMIAAFALPLKVQGFWNIWRQHDADTRQIVAAFDRLTPGSLLLPVMADGDGTELSYAHRHTASYATVARVAFVPTNYTGTTGLSARPAYKQLQHPSWRATEYKTFIKELSAGGVPAAADDMPHKFWRRWWVYYDYLLLMSAKAIANPYPQLLEEIDKGRVFSLYRVRRENVAGFVKPE